MKLLLQILLFFFIWFSSCATLSCAIVALPIYTISFPKADNQKLESELKIGVSNFARSNISENSFSQKTVLWESSVLENRAHEANVRVVNGAGSRIARTLDEIAPSGIIPSNSQTNNLFHKWFDDLIPEELDLVLGNPSLKEALEARIRYPGGLHEWCMVCEIKTFKSWEVSMSEIHRFRTKTLDLTGVHPTTGATFVHGGAGSTAFHNELRTMIQQSTSLADFNTRLSQLVSRWQIDPNLLPPLIK